MTLESEHAAAVRAVEDDAATRVRAVQRREAVAERLSESRRAGWRGAFFQHALNNALTVP